MFFNIYLCQNYGLVVVPVGDSVDGAGCVVVVVPVVDVPGLVVGEPGADGTPDDAGYTVCVCGVVLALTALGALVPCDVVLGIVGLTIVLAELEFGATAGVVVGDVVVRIVLLVCGLIV